MKYIEEGEMIFRRGMMTDKAMIRVSLKRVMLF